MRRKWIIIIEAGSFVSEYSSKATLLRYEDNFSAFITPCTMLQKPSIWSRNYIAAILIYSQRVYTGSSKFWPKGMSLQVFYIALNSTISYSFYNVKYVYNNHIGVRYLILPLLIFLQGIAIMRFIAWSTQVATRNIYIAATI